MGFAGAVSAVLGVFVGFAATDARVADGKTRLG